MFFPCDYVTYEYCSILNLVDFLPKLFTRNFSFCVSFESRLQTFRRIASRSDLIDSVNDGRDVNGSHPPADQRVFRADRRTKVFVESRWHRNVDPVDGQNRNRLQNKSGNDICDFLSIFGTNVCSDFVFFAFHFGFYGLN